MKCCEEDDKVLEAKFPVNLQSHIQYGDNVSAFIVLLNNLGVSCDRIEELFDNAYNISLCQSTIINKINKCSKLIEPTLNEIKERLSKSKFIHCDESGVRVEGLTMWTHSASTDLYTYLTCSAKRGYDGIVDNGVLVSMVGGCAIHDCWAPYWKFHNVEHAICLQHILRELKWVNQCAPNQKWDVKFRDFLLKVKKAKEKLIAEDKNSFDKEALAKIKDEFDKIIKLGEEENPLPEQTEIKRGRKPKGEIRALVDRLKRYKTETLKFAEDFSIPFTNNTAEQSVRNVKVKIKNAGCFRSKEGADNYLKIRSFLDTAKKQGKNLMESLLQVFRGNSNYILVPTSKKQAE